MTDSTADHNLKTVREVEHLLTELLAPERIRAAIDIISDTNEGQAFLARVLAKYVDEDKSDELLEYLEGLVEAPWWAKGFVFRLLDRLLPEVVIEPLLKLLWPDNYELPSSNLYEYLRKL